MQVLSQFSYIVMKIIYLVLVTLISVNHKSIFSQTPIKFGKIDTTELKMKVYDKDTTASAVVLFDMGEFDASNITFTRHLQLKIFRKEGSWYVNQVINTPSKSFIKGCTYNWKDGQIVETKLKDESIFREQVRNDYYRFRVTMPDVVDGSVVELVYSFTGLPSEWRFQDIIPIKRSELHIPKPIYFSFHKTLYGFQPLYQITDDRWVGIDMPALHEEPYVNSITNYLTKLEIELEEVFIPKYFMKSFTSSWDAVNDYLLEHQLFGVQIKDLGFYLADDIKEIKEKYTSDELKLKAAYELVRKQVKWNNQCSLFASGQLSYSYNNHSGNSADINLILIKLLKKLGFEVYPVALSTRENGIISPACPTINKMNYVIACIFLDGKSHFLDATEKYLPLGLLPERCLNGMGRIIRKENSDWIDVSTVKTSKKLTYIQSQLNENGCISLNISQSYYDYAALNFRNELLKFNTQDEYLAELESNSPGIKIDTITISNLDSLNLPVKSVMKMNLENPTDMRGEIIFINPLFTERMKESPFKHEQRKYPVDYATPKYEKTTIQFKMPDGFSIEELPKSMNITLPDKKARYSYNISFTDNTIQLNSIFEIASSVFTESEYGLLREFYNQVIAKQNEAIIIRKAIKQN
jgi:hypothetical protein